MRFANDIFKQRPIVPGFNTEDSMSIALLPGGVQGPAQGPNIPIKKYGDKYMPDATQPSGYRPTPGGFV